MGWLILFGMAWWEQLTFNETLHPLDLLQGLAVTVGLLEAGRTQQTKLFVNVTQFPVQMLHLVALLLSCFHHRWRIQMRTTL